VNVLSIQSHVAYGHVGNAAAVFALQRLGIEVWPIHTVQYSNHKGYGGWTGDDFSARHVAALIDGLSARGVLGACDGVLSGYVGRAEIGAAIVDAVARVRRANPAALYACDPVMGDDATGLYVESDLPAFFRARAMPLAHIATPNRFELERLTDRRVETLADAIGAARALNAMGPSVVLVTSLRHDRTAPDEIETLAVSPTGAWRVRAPLIPFDTAPNGAGDTIAALFLAHYLKTRDCPRALEAAVAGIFAVLEATRAAGTRELALIAAQDAMVDPPRRFAAEPLA